MMVDQEPKNPAEENEKVEGQVSAETDGSHPEETGHEAVQLEAIQKELEEYRSKADEYLDGWQRSRAEFMNYKKRVERDQAQLYQVTAGNIIRQFLEVMDDMERALVNSPADGEGKAWAEGIELIYRKLQKILETYEVTEIKAQGQPFDPNLHEALTSEESDEYESGQVIEVLQKGYLIGDRVLRPARVRVAK